MPARRPRSRKGSRNIPNRAPEEWPGRCHTSEDVADFVRRVWSRFICEGLTLRDIERRDVRLYNAIRNYQSVTGKPWPKDLSRLSERGRVADALERVRQHGVSAVTPKELMAVARKLARDSAHK